MASSLIFSIELRGMYYMLRTFFASSRNTAERLRAWAQWLWYLAMMKKKKTSFINTYLFAHRALLWAAHGQQQSLEDSWFDFSVSVSKNTHRVYEYNIYI
jgi:hypothetical protein